MQAAIARPEALFPQPWFPVAVMPIAADSSDLHPAERALLPRAVPARLAAYAAGRRCARHALRQLDATADAPILRDAHGCPRWPRHVVGSISHSPLTAVAVVAARADAQAVGVDIESPDRDIGIETLARVFSQRESEWLAQQPHVHRTRLAYAVFSAREALYKCVYQACGHRLAPGEVELQLDMGRGVFRAEWRAAACALGLPPYLFGRVGFDTLHVFAGVWCARLARPLSFIAPEPAHDLAIA